MNRCAKCNFNFDGKEKFIECGICCGRFHIQCVNLSEDDLEFLCSLHKKWNCDICFKKLKSDALKESTPIKIITSSENAFQPENSSSLETKYKKKNESKIHFLLKQKNLAKSESRKVFSVDPKNVEKCEPSLNKVDESKILDSVEMKMRPLNDKVSSFKAEFKKLLRRVDSLEIENSLLKVKLSKLESEVNFCNRKLASNNLAKASSKSVGETKEEVNQSIENQLRILSACKEGNKSYWQKQHLMKELANESQRSPTVLKNLKETFKQRLMKKRKLSETVRKDLQCDKEAAIETEERLKSHKFKHTSTIKNEDNSENCSEISEDSFTSLNTTVKLLKYIQNALSDVPDKESVLLLQDKIVEELQRQESRDLDDSRSYTSDTLNNIDSISLNEEKSPLLLDSGKSTLPEYSVEFNSVNSPRNSILSETNSVQSEELQKTPSKLIRSNSYILESPTPSVIKFLKSVTREPDDSQDIVITSSQRVNNKKITRNLNDFWPLDSSDNQLDELRNPSMPESPGAEINKLSTINKSSLQVINQKQKKSKLKNLADVNHWEGKDKNDNTITSAASVDVTKSKYIQKNYQDNEKILKAIITIQSYVRGYLVRRLLRTNKVIELKSTIKDSLIYALALHTELSVDSADANLYVSLIRQVTAACYELHHIFFEWTIKEKMMLINQDRIRAKRPKTPQSASPKDESQIIGITPSSKDLQRNRTSLEMKSPHMKSPSSSNFNYKPWK